MVTPATGVTGARRCGRPDHSDHARHARGSSQSRSCHPWDASGTGTPVASAVTAHQRSHPRSKVSRRQAQGVAPAVIAACGRSRPLRLPRRSQLLQSARRGALCGRSRWPRVAPRGPAVPVDPRRLALAEPEAMRLLLSRWGLNLKDFPAGDTCDRLPAYGLRCERDRGGWRPLRALDIRPCLRLRQRKGQPQSYVVLVAMDAESVTLAHPEGNVRLTRAEINPLLSGYYTLVWQPPPMGTASISAGSSGESVRWLRKLLSQVPDSGITDTESGAFDAAVGAALRRFQVKYGLNPDGIAGPKTLIQLNNAVGMPGIPKLSRGT